MSSASLIILLAVVVAFNVVAANPYGYPGPGYPGGPRGGYNAPVPYGQPPFMPPPPGYGMPPIVIKEDDNTMDRILPLLLILLCN